jgi:hypothetical protein
MTQLLHYAGELRVVDRFDEMALEAGSGGAFVARPSFVYDSVGPCNLA